jgi:hypothetical protein
VRGAVTIISRPHHPNLFEHRGFTFATSGGFKTLYKFRLIPANGSVTIIMSDTVDDFLAYIESGSGLSFDDWTLQQAQPAAPAPAPAHVLTEEEKDEELARRSICGENSRWLRTKKATLISKPILQTA